MDAKSAAAPSIRATLWAQLESTDLAVYASNLHAAGCPPKTVRDILLPLIEGRFLPSQRSDVEPTNFWASFSQRQAAANAQTGHERGLHERKDQMLKELLGFAWDLNGLKHAYTGEATSSVGFLDYDRAEKLLCIAERVTKQASEVSHSRNIERRSAFYQTWREGATEVLSSSEFEEAELRRLLTILQRRNPNLCKVGLSGSELRQLTGFRRELSPPLPSAWLTESDDLLAEPDFAGEQQFLTKVRRLLGDSRFIDYLKSTDASINKTVATLEKAQLPQSLALQLFDLRQEALTRAQDIRQRPLRRSDKRAQLAALRQSALEELAALPNAEPESPLLEVNRDWLQAIGNP